MHTVAPCVCLSMFAFAFPCFHVPTYEILPRYPKTIVKRHAFAFPCFHVPTYEILTWYLCALLRHTFTFPGCLPMCINGTTLAMVRPFENATRLLFRVSTTLHMKYYLGIYVHYCDTCLPFQVVSITIINIGPFALATHTLTE